MRYQFYDIKPKQVSRTKDNLLSMGISVAIGFMLGYAIVQTIYG